MADWLDEIEKKKNRAMRERQEQWERGKPEREARAKAAKAVYERLKNSIDETFDSIRSYVSRANDLAEARVYWALNGLRGTIKKENSTRGQLKLSIRATILMNTLCSMLPIRFLEREATPGMASD
jgi:hypothetical protein